MCSYCIQQAAGLVELHLVNCQLRLKVALLSQQVGYQNANQVRTAGTGQNLDLQNHCYLTTVFHIQVVSLFTWPLSSLYLVQKAGEERVGHIVVKKCPFIHQDTFDVLSQGWIFTQQLHTRLSQNRLKRQIYNICTFLSIY